MAELLVTVAETRTFQRAAAALFEPVDVDELIGFLAANPTAGVVVPGSKGLRKLRWGARGKGKRGGARVIYYYRTPALPLYLLAAFAKSQQADLTFDQLREARLIVDALNK